MMVNDDCYKCKVSKANQSFIALPGLESGGRGCYSSTVLSLLELPLSHSDDILLLWHLQELSLVTYPNTINIKHVLCKPKIPNNGCCNGAHTTNSSPTRHLLYHATISPFSYFIKS